MHGDRGNQSVTAAVECLDIPRCLGRVAERHPEFVHRLVQAAIEINESVIRPKGVPQLVAGHDLTRVLE